MVEYVDLCPAETIFFLPQGGTQGQHKLFLEILKETWQRLPAADRKTILDYHWRVYNTNARVRLGAPIKYPAPLAEAGPEGFMLSCDVLHIFDLPGGQPWIGLVIAEEFAHAYMIAIQHPTHVSRPPNNDPTTPDYQAWILAMEDAMKEVLFIRWHFDATEHAKIIVWLKSVAVVT